MDILKQRLVRTGLLVLLVLSCSVSLSDLSAQTVYKRKVVAEEFTGTWCQYCPIGAWTLDSIEHYMGETLVEFAWHIAGGDPFEIKAGVDLDKALNVQGYPNASIDRRVMLGNYGWSKNNPWYRALVQDANQAPLVDVRITNGSFTGTKFEFDVEVTPLDLATLGKEDTCKYVLVVAVGEDKLVYAQQYINGEVFEDFVHDNVIRRTLTNVLGDQITLGTKTPLTAYPFKKHFSLTIDGAWQANNIRIKTFVARKSNIAANGQFILNADQTAYVGSLGEDAPNAIWVLTPADNAQVDHSKVASVIWSKQGTVAAAKIEYTVDGGTTWSVISDNATLSPVSWTIPESAYGKTGQIRITDKANAATTFTGPEFSITAPEAAAIAVTKPATGEVLFPGTQYTITWEVSGPVTAQRTVEISVDGGTTWTEIASLTGAQTSFTWTVPDYINQRAYIRVRDGNNVIGMSGEFVIYTQGQISTLGIEGNPTKLDQNTEVVINWSASGDLGDALTLSYSENGENFGTLAAELPITQTSYTWKTPNKYVAQAWLKLTSETGANRTIGPFQIGEPASVDPVVARATYFDASYPNPINGSSEIRFSLGAPAHVLMTVTSVLGQEIATLIDGFRPAGSNAVTFDAAQLPAGTYLCRMCTNGLTRELKLTVAE